MSEAEAVTLSLSLPKKHNLVYERNGVTAYKSSATAYKSSAPHVFSKGFEDSSPSCPYLLLPLLNSVFCTMCPAHIRSWEHSHMLPCTYPLVHLLSTASVRSKEKGCHVSCLSETNLTLKNNRAPSSHKHISWLFVNDGFHSGVSPPVFCFH